MGKDRSLSKLGEYLSCGKYVRFNDFYKKIANIKHVS
jgi:hypothetical protein